MHASFALLLLLILLTLSRATYDVTRSSAGSVTTGASVEAAARRAAAETTDPDTVASKLQGVLFKSFVEWSNVDDMEPESDQNDSNADYAAHEQELTTHLQQVLGVAEHLLHVSRGCNYGGGMGSSSSDGGHGRRSPSVDCPAAAPELLQGGTSAFLASLLRTYPRGPTSREALAAWAAAATAFLQQHRELQRQQRQAAAEAADRAAAVLSQAQSQARSLLGAATYATAADAGKEVAGATRRGPPLAPAAAAPAAARSSDPQEAQQQQQWQQQQQPEQWQQQPEQRQQRQLASGRSAAAAAQRAEAPDGRGRWGDDGGGGGVSQDNNGGRGGGGGEGDPDRMRGFGAVAGGRTATAMAGGTRLLTADPRVNSTDSLNVTHRVAPGSSTVTAGGLPLVRRVLLAQLLLGWVSGMRRELPPTVEVAEGLARLLSQLYYIHVDSVVDRAALEYFHISKSGGTSWTAAAKANGCVIPIAKAARTPGFDDDCRWFDPGVLLRLGLTQLQAARTLVCPRYGIIERRSVLRDCARRLEHFRRTGLQYTSNEYTLHGGRDDMYGTHICPQFVTVATIREPLGRLVSNVRYMMVQLKRDKSVPPEVFQQAFCNRSAADWEVYAPPVTDNYNIRTLVGERAFHTPLYGIGEAHEALAKQLLVQYDLVLDLNAGDAAADLLMRQGLGWNTTLAEVHVWTSDKLAKRGSLDFTRCHTGDLEPLMGRQVYDQRWYSFGRSLSRLDQLFLSAAAHMGLRPWPAEWRERGLGPPPEEGFVREDCGLVGLVPPLPHTPSPSPPPSADESRVSPPPPPPPPRRPTRQPRAATGGTGAPLRD